MKNPRVTGLGGIFFKAKNPTKSGAWYKQHLGLPVETWGGCAFPWRDAKNPKKKGSTVWSPFDSKTKYFGPGKQVRGLTLWIVPPSGWTRRAGPPPRES